jgi:hypothetical protein
LTINCHEINYLSRNDLFWMFIGRYNKILFLRAVNMFAKIIYKERYVRLLSY